MFNAGANSDGFGRRAADFPENLRSMIWDTRSDAVYAVMSFLTSQDKQGKLDRAVNGGNNFVVRCATRLDNRGNLIVPDSDERAAFLCGFRVPLLKIKSGPHQGKWHLSRSAILEHRNCLGRAMPKARELVASSSLRGAVLANRGMSAQALQEAITMQEGVTPKKHTLYRAKNILLRQEDKTYAKDFQKIASWCQEFQDLGNGMAHMSVDEDNAFLSVTVINRAAARRLVRAGQLVSRVNVASMHHRHYRGQILALEATDGNAKNILVGVRMCPYGTAEQYSGLFRAAKSTEFEPGSRMEAWLNSAGHVVLAGQESEVLPAKQAELPHARTAKCCRHLLATCRSKVGGFKSEELFWAAQQAGTYAMFLQKMAEFHAAYPKQAEYFSDIPHEHWAVYKQIEMAIKTYGQCTTTSLAKSEASQMLPMRNYAPLGALDKIAREMCQEADRAREEAREMLARGQILISFAQADLDEQTRLSGTCIAVKAGDGIGLVKQLTNQGAVEETVNFNAKTCTCGLWQRMGRPCRHAVKFAPLHFNPVALQIDPGLWFRFAWDPIYLVAVYSIVTEDGAIIPPDLERLIPDGVTLPPKQTGTEARAAKQRKRCATDESGNSKRTGRPLKVQKCANCREPGHKLPTCPRPVASD